MQVTGHSVWIWAVQNLSFAAWAVYSPNACTLAWQAEFVVDRSAHDSRATGHCPSLVLAPMQLTGHCFWMKPVQYLLLAASALYATPSEFRSPAYACTPAWHAASGDLSPSHDSNRGIPSRQRPQLRAHRRSTVSVQNLAFPASSSSPSWSGKHWAGVVCDESSQSSGTSGGGGGHSGCSLHSSLHAFLHFFLHFLRSICTMLVAQPSIFKS